MRYDYQNEKHRGVRANGKLLEENTFNLSNLPQFFRNQEYVMPENDGLDWTLPQNKANIPIT